MLSLFILCESMVLHSTFHYKYDLIKTIYIYILRIINFQIVVSFHVKKNSDKVICDKLTTTMK